ncbi:IclR family transcriptional regulator [Caenispirillum salinarum]|uniref:IclR family transcriptional regulator n=1 Tax=Caenispirillum salinarum TaxID=859058 RepID=UPI00384AB4C4
MRSAGGRSRPLRAAVGEDAGGGANGHEGEGARRRGVQSLEVAMGVLRALGEAARPLMLKELADRAGMPPAKAHRYLVSFIESGMVRQDAETGRYALGEFALTLGLVALQGLDIVRDTASVLADLRDHLEETVFLAVWGNRGPTIVRWEEAARPIAVNVRVGSVLPVETSATGRVFAAFLKEAAGHAVDRAMVEEIRATGLATQRNALMQGIGAVSSPVFDHRGQIVGAITVLGADTGFDASPTGRIARACILAGEDASRRMGHRPDLQQARCSA